MSTDPRGYFVFSPCTSSLLSLAGKGCFEVKGFVPIRDHFLDDHRFEWCGAKKTYQCRVCAIEKNYINFSKISQTSRITLSCHWVRGGPIPVVIGAHTLCECCLLVSLTILASSVYADKFLHLSVSQNCVNVRDNISFMHAGIIIVSQQIAPTTLCSRIYLVRMLSSGTFDHSRTFTARYGCCKIGRSSSRKFGVTKLCDKSTLQPLPPQKLLSKECRLQLHRLGPHTKERSETFSIS